MKKIVGLIIMDGFGLANPSESNSVYLAKKPFYDYLLKAYPTTTLKASGLEVGLPEGQMGNSEVGHLNLGAGRIVYQSLTRIDQAIKDKSFFDNESFLKAINHVKENNSKLHVLGLISDGGVHSHINHFKALLDLAKDYNINPYLHVFLDGRDTSPTGGYEYVKELIDCGWTVATVSGRYYAMDRDNNWDRLQIAYDNLTSGVDLVYTNPLEGIKASYHEGVTDEFLKPFLVNKNGLIESNDSIIFANFRPDRAIRMSVAITNPNKVSNFYTKGKAEFKLTKALENIFFVSMMHYHDDVIADIAFPLQTLENLYGEVIANNGLSQVRIAETEKYPHVTFFFDGGREIELKNSDRILVESPKVPTYDLMPEMSAYGVRDKAIEAIKSNKYDTMILNFANPDMVGHTGSIPATIKAVEVVDECVKDVTKAILDTGGIAIILADHGNAEVMKDEFGNPHTAHTTNLVPVIITKKGLTLSHGKLGDIAPTMLELLNIEKPVQMTGNSIIKK